MKIYDAVRQKWVKNTPEEKVRQQIIGELVELGFPKEWMAVEVGLHSLAHVANPLDRRADLICFAKDVHPDYSLYPILLVECKANRLLDDHLRQAEGYNSHVLAHFVMVANAEEVKISSRGGPWQDGLCRYVDLFRLAKNSLASGDKSKI